MSGSLKEDAIVGGENGAADDLNTGQAAALEDGLDNRRASGPIARRKQYGDQSHWQRGDGRADERGRRLFVSVAVGDPTASRLHFAGSDRRRQRRACERHDPKNRSALGLDAAAIARQLDGERSDLKRTIDSMASGTGDVVNHDPEIGFD